MVICFLEPNIQITNDFSLHCNHCIGKNGLIFGDDGKKQFRVAENGNRLGKILQFFRDDIDWLLLRGKHLPRRLGLRHGLQGTPAGGHHRRAVSISYLSISIKNAPGYPKMGIRSVLAYFTPSGYSPRARVRAAGSGSAPRKRR